jgi:hypothetical protein
MAPTKGMLRYNTDNKYFERSVDNGAIWSQLDLSGVNTIPPPVVIPGPQITRFNFNSTGIVNNLTIPNSRHTRIEVTSAANATITGVFVTGGNQDGDVIEFTFSMATASIVISFPYQSTSSSAGNTFTNFASSIDTPVTTRGYVRYVYSSVIGYWWMTHHEQGSLIKGYDLTSVVVEGGGTLTGFAYVQNQFKITGTTVFWQIYPFCTTISGTVINIEIPNPMVNMRWKSVQYSNLGASGVNGPSSCRSATELGGIRLKLVLWNAQGSLNFGAGSTQIFGDVNLEII